MIPSLALDDRLGALQGGARVDTSPFDDAVCSADYFPASMCGGSTLKNSASVHDASRS
jgi:hypothetical protein